MRPTPKQQTAVDVLRAVVGGVLNPDFGALTAEERDAVLEPHSAAIERGAQALGVLLDGARGEGFSEAHHHIRSADAFDPAAVDEVITAQLEPDEGAVPVEVPRRPWPGGL
jgi:hypothetical protein